MEVHIFLFLVIVFCAQAPSINVVVSSFRKFLAVLHRYFLISLSFFLCRVIRFANTMISTLFSFSSNIQVLFPVQVLPRLQRSALRLLVNEIPVVYDCEFWEQCRISVNAIMVLICFFVSGSNRPHVVHWDAI